MMYLSIIVPLYNEEIRLRQYLPALLASVKKLLPNSTFEIVLVNDGSTDATDKIVSEYQKEYPAIIKNVMYTPNRGKGYALQQGVLQSNGEYVCFTDIDLSVKPDAISFVLPLLEQGNDVVIGSRHRKGSQIVVDQPLMRRIMGRGYVLLANTLFESNRTDFTCGFKAFRRDAAHYLFSHLTCYRWSFDAEILALSTLKKMKVVEVPVVWKNNFSSKVRLSIDVVISFYELLSIWLKLRTGVYEK